METGSTRASAKPATGEEGEEEGRRERNKPDTPINEVTDF